MRTLPRYGCLPEVGAGAGVGGNAGAGGGICKPGTVAPDCGLGIEAPFSKIVGFIFERFKATKITVESEPSANVIPDQTLQI